MFTTSINSNRPADLNFYNEHGWLIIDLLDATTVAALKDWVAEVQSWSDDVRWLNHYEQTEFGPRKCRTEYFTPYHPQLRELLRGGIMVDIASQLLGEPAVLYKEKINYKLAGGAGWEPHQDAPAYPFISTHVSCMIAVDDATHENGCLEIVSGMHNEILGPNEFGCIPKEVVDTLDWRMAPLRAGQTLWFHSRTPHRSGDNKSTRDRRAIYPTYNALSEGDLRETYYEKKRQDLSSSAVNERVRVSLIDDFRGIPVTP